MAEETKIGMKLDMELEPIKDMCKKLEEAVKHELSKGIENVDAKELGEVVDMIKDLYEAKEKIVKACYYKGVLEAMEEHDFEDEDEIEDEGRRGYRGQRRDSRGRYMSNRGRRGYESYMMPDMDYEEMERMRDYDRSAGKMYYSGSGSSGGSSSGMSSGGSSSSGMSSGSMGSQGGNRGYSDGGRGNSESRYDRARRGYEETKSMHKDNSAESKQMKMKSLEDYTKELASDISDMVQDMSAEEKNLLRTKLQTLAQKVS